MCGRSRLFPDGAPTAKSILSSAYIHDVELAGIRIVALSFMSAMTVLTIPIRAQAGGTPVSFFKYLTNWSWLLLITYYILVYACYISSLQTGHVPRALRYVTHIAFDTVSPIVFVVTIGGWFEIIDMFSQYDIWYGAWSVIAHGGNLIIIVVDVVLGKHVYYPWHIVFVYGYGILYCVNYIVIYAESKTPVYHQVGWEWPTTPLALVAAFAITALAYVFLTIISTLTDRTPDLESDAPHVHYGHDLMTTHAMLITRTPRPDHE